ncbi:hypothetical protein RJ639_033587, partial [Escallonia herrerae]
ASSALIKSRKPTDAKLDYSHITVPVVVDHTGCNANEDINFQFTGFSISGKVVGAVGGESCSHKTGGPSNVNVELLSRTGDLVSSVLTSPTGSYSFTNIIPGSYQLRASHRDFNVEVELGFNNGVVDNIFFVPGYNIRGSVVAQGNPILGVHIYLYSDDISEVDCPQESNNAPGQRKALCHAVSDADGMFVFRSIPCGNYELIPYYKGENTVFDVSPPSLSVSVQHDHSIVPQKFQWQWCVKIIVDGHERSVTDKKGYYKLDQVTSNHYTIEATKEHYKFDKLKEFLVLPNMASVVDIKAVSYDVCGVVQVANSGYKAKVALTHGPENVKPQVKQTDGSGNFCFEVQPGEYRLSAFAATPESTPELLFLPPYADVVVDSPLLNVKFYQAQVNVRGSVACKEECGSSVSVTLRRLDSRTNEEKKAVSLTDQSSDFIFPNVLPGKYGLEVKHHSPGSVSGEDNWCWDQNLIIVDIGIADIEGIFFVQKGYWVNVISSHNVEAYLTQPDGSHVNLKIKKGSQRICVQSPGVHELHFVKSCIFFGSTSVKIDTSNLSPVSLKGAKYLLKGQIYVESSSLNGVDKLPENILVDILNNEGTVSKLISNGNDQSRAAVYGYSTWANPGEELTFVPRDSRNNGEKKLLFYPRQHHVMVSGDGCQDSVPPFVGRLGLYIEGSVSPPLSDVHIRVIAMGDSPNAAIKKGDLAVETTTTTDGSFVGGPLYDDITYSIEASKPGYYVKAVGPHSFSCQKLGQISVHIYSKEDAKVLFPAVLLSLSGDDGYRNNSVAGAGGNFLFDNLFPGSFYLRPLLKEYAFSPPAQAIELGSGESREVIFQATRVAYSAMGTVSLLSGQPKEGVSVEARSDLKGLYEETVTDSSGSYRLRGLLPDTAYTIKVARKGDLDSSRIERASPESVAVEIGYEDIRALDFLVFEQPEMTILSGYVEGARIKELNAHLRLEIKSASDPSKTEAVLPLPLSNFFQVKDLPKGKHLLQLRSALPSNTLKFKSDVIEVDLEKNTQIHLGPVRYSVEEEYHKQELTTAPLYPIIVGVSAIALFVSMPRLKDLYQATVGVSVLGSAATAKKEARKPVVRKKTY